MGCSLVYALLRGKLLQLNCGFPLAAMYVCKPCCWLDYHQAFLPLLVTSLNRHHM
jgi:hypothetical protein